MIRLLFSIIQNRKEVGKMLVRLFALELVAGKITLEDIPTWRNLRQKVIDYCKDVLGVDVTE